jgi:hypothetical protein
MDKLFSTLKFIVNCKYKIDTKKKKFINLIKSYLPNTFINWLWFFIQILKWCVHIFVYLFSFNIILNNNTYDFITLMFKWLNHFNSYWISFIERIDWEKLLDIEEIEEIEDNQIDKNINLSSFSLEEELDKEIKSYKDLNNSPSIEEKQENKTIEELNEDSLRKKYKSEIETIKNNDSKTYNIIGIITILIISGLIVSNWDVISAYISSLFDGSKPTDDLIDLNSQPSSPTYSDYFKSPKFDELRELDGDFNKTTNSEAKCDSIERSYSNSSTGSNDSNKTVRPFKPKNLSPNH